METRGCEEYVYILVNILQILFIFKYGNVFNIGQFEDERKLK